MIKVEIENYFGNTIMNLEFYVNLKKRGVTKMVEQTNIEPYLFVFEEIANKHGYNVADLEEEERNSAWAQVREFLGQFKTETGWKTELEVVIASGNS